MSPRSTSFDEETEVRATRPDEAARVLRGRVNVRWTDAAGNHSADIEGTGVIGSSRSVEVVVADPTVSRMHAELSVRDGALWIRDLGSTNGTEIEGIAVREARVSAGNRIRVGGTTLTVRGVSPVDAELWPDDRFGPMLGASSTMRELFARLDRVAKSDASVLVTGETGSGKELVAQAIHDASPRAQAPLVVVDCAAMPEKLLEDELFGHAKGAFTGALQARAGAIEAAQGGTVFLDEIGELPSEMQPKLLRVLESRTVRRIGETAHRKVDVRFVAATHRDLRRMVNEGRFREDLYFRLAVIPVEVPPLRDRPEDIPLLIEHFLPRSSDQLRSELVRDARERPWPGNVRELRNFVERAVALGTRAALALSDADRTSATEKASAFPPIDVDRSFHEIRDEWLDHLERGYVRRILERHGGHISAAAEAAGLDRSYLHRLIRKHRL